MKSQFSVAAEVTRLKLHSGQSLLTSAATLLIFVANPTLAQPTNDIPPLQPALPEIPPTLWEQHGILMMVLGVVAVAMLIVAIWWLLQPRPPVPVPIESQTRRELERCCSGEQ